MVTIGEQEEANLRRMNAISEINGSFGEMPLNMGEVNPLREEIDIAILSDDARQVGNFIG